MPECPDLSPRLSLPYIQPSQAQKYVIHNEGMRRLDVLVQMSVTSVDEEALPPHPRMGHTISYPPAPRGIGWVRPKVCWLSTRETLGCFTLRARVGWPGFRTQTT